jgi:uncharacterized protein YbjT (DUF2867 family)
LVLLLREQGHDNLVCIDKHADNLRLLGQLNPGVRVVEADLSQPGDWESEFQGANAAIVLHAQITGKTDAPFITNNIEASRLVYAAIQKANVPYTIQVSSSVVNSVADDAYTRTKREQERIFLQSGLPGCVLRPTLMFGWFDPKHLGWLARLMDKSPVFPIPGDGRFMRQPLYNRDFCKVVLWCLEHRPIGRIFDLIGDERIDYVDIIREIRRAKHAKTLIVHLPYGVFDGLLRLFALFVAKPPFTSDQLRALSAGDDFSGVDPKATFGLQFTPLRKAIEETFCHPVYSKYSVGRTD